MAGLLRLVGALGHHHEQDESPEVQARAEVLRVLDAHRPGVVRALDLKHLHPTDRQLLEALARYDSPFATLRAAGCALGPAARVSELLPKAIASRDRKPARFFSTWRCRWPQLLGGFMLFVSVACLGIALWQLFGETMGWTRGTCVINMFSNATCRQAHGGCALEVDIKGAERILQMRNWQAPVETDYDTRRIVYAGEPFRCCQMSDVLDCCSFYDSTTQAFCDSWPHRVDRFGMACPRYPADGWPCLFKRGQVGGEDEATSLQVYEPPTTWPLFATSGALLVLLACGAGLAQLRSQGVELPRLRFHPSSSKVSSFRASGMLSRSARSPPRSPTSKKAPAKPSGTSAPSRLSAGSDPSAGALLPGAPPLEAALPGAAVPEAEAVAADPEAAWGVEAPVAVPKAASRSPSVCSPPAAPAAAAAVRKASKAEVNQDEHPMFKTGDLSYYAAQSTAHLMQPIIAPKAKKQPRARTVPAQLPSGARRSTAPVKQFAATDPKSWPWADQANPVPGGHANELGRPRSTLREAANPPGPARGADSGGGRLKGSVASRPVTSHLRRQ